MQCPGPKYTNPRPFCHSESISPAANCACLRGQSSCQPTYLNYLNVLNRPIAGDSLQIGKAGRVMMSGCLQYSLTSRASPKPRVMWMRVSLGNGQRVHLAGLSWGLVILAYLMEMLNHREYIRNGLYSYRNTVDLLAD